MRESSVLFEVGHACEKLSGFEAYLDPKEPTFLGFLIMNSLL